MKVAVTSRSFSSHPVLCEELHQLFPEARLNSAGHSLTDGALLSFLGDAEGAIVGLERIDDNLLDALPNLCVISKYGVGVDALDLYAMQARGVRLGWTGGVNRQAVAELTLFCMVGLLRRYDECRNLIEGGGWKQLRGRELSAATVGIIGCGHIGKQVARLLRAYGARVLAHDLRHFGEFYRQHDVEPVGFDELLERSNIVTLHLPLDETTRGILDQARLARMQPGALLINIARGGLVDEEQLAQRLVDGCLGGAALDVLDNEPPTPEHPLFSAPNVMLTPHIGGSTEESVLAMGRAAIAGLANARLPRDIFELWPVSTADTA